MAMALVIFGCIVLVLGWIWLLGVAFKESAVWGILTLLGLGFIFVIMYWEKSWRPFLVNLAGFGFLILGECLSGVFR